MAKQGASPRTLGAAMDAPDNSFNLVRLVLALAVLAYHAWQLNPVAPRADPLSAVLQPVTDLGGLAVAAFFLVSGLFVTASWQRDPHPLRFVLRRAARLLPALFACLLVTTVLAVAFFSDAGPAGLLSAEPWRYIASNTAFHLLRYEIPLAEYRIPGVLGGMVLNGPLWTLYWEVRLYLLLVLLGVAAVLPMQAWLRGASVFLLVAANLFPQVLSGYVWELRMLSMFLAGVLLQTLAGQARVTAIHVLACAALLAVNWPRNAALTGSGATWFGLALLAGAAALWAGSARVPGTAHLRRHDYSYGIYIWHWPVMLMLRVFLPAADAPLLLAAALAVTLPLAALSWHLIEAPAIARVRRRLARPRKGERLLHFPHDRQTGSG